MSATFQEQMRHHYGDKNLKRPVSREEVFGLIETLVEANKKLAARIEMLEQREYKGVYEDGREYTRGQFVTLKGGMWHCNRKTRQRPGESGDWTLAVKAGRDGKDAR